MRCPVPPGVTRSLPVLRSSIAGPLPLLPALPVGRAGTTAETGQRCCYAAPSAPSRRWHCGRRRPAAGPGANTELAGVFAVRAESCRSTGAAGGPCNCADDSGVPAPIWPGGWPGGLSGGWPGGSPGRPAQDRSLSQRPGAGGDQVEPSRQRQERGEGDGQVRREPGHGGRCRTGLISGEPGGALGADLFACHPGRHPADDG